MTDDSNVLTETRLNFFGNKVLEKLGITASQVDTVIAMYFEAHRHYHNISHLLNLLMEDATQGNDLLDVIALFHDAIYIPGANDNEQRSADLFREMCQSTDTAEFSIIYDAILDTGKYLETKLVPSSSVSKSFMELDLAALLRGPLEELIKNEELLFKEFQSTGVEMYRTGRFAFLSDFAEFRRDWIKDISALSALRDYISARRYKVGVYAGSFSPFHVGHMNILEQAEAVFDKVIVVKAVHPDKPKLPLMFPDVEAILPFHQVVEWDGLIVDFFKELRYGTTEYTLIRGLRNGYDLQYEMNYMKALRDMDQRIRCAYFVCEAAYEHVSSTLLRQLDTFTTMDRIPYIPRKYNFTPEAYQPGGTK